MEVSRLRSGRLSGKKNYPTNSIDEEDDQTSSCESEPEGENAEELASLETPDEEGEWC